MIIYNPHNEPILLKRLKEVEHILNHIPVKHCLITGSFLYKEQYKDIDLFVITRKKVKINLKNDNLAVTILDFNDLYSLFFHSASKSCVSKNILPIRPIKVTMTDYWSVVNEAVPTILNQKDRYHKNIRFLVLYTEYLKNGRVLDTFELTEKVHQFKRYNEILEYITIEAPSIIHKWLKKSYLKRYFYTQSGFYKNFTEYNAQDFLYRLAQNIARNGQR